ncbi:MAG TPA: hypothetical protein VM925_25020 [Labilithrix sp.]|nr:hypothetical protein [Labilithrix sp.]
MSERDLERELRDLVELEKGALVDPADARSRLAERLGPLFAAAGSLPGGDPPVADVPPGASAVGNASTVAMTARAIPWTTILSALGGGVVLGSALTATALRTTPPEPRVEIRYVDRIVEGERAPDAGPPLVTPDALPSVPSRRVERPSPPAPSSSATEASDQALARERQIIDKARSALARRDAAAALAAADEHARAFPHGQLTEMREALAVQALVIAGRTSDARTRAARFHAKYPGSIYAPIVDGAISSAP